MATTAVKKILAEALALPGGERALLARELLASLDGQELDGEEAEHVVTQEWAREIERRIRAARSGESPSLDGPATLDEIFG
jgi:hypothetical protein